MNKKYPLDRSIVKQVDGFFASYILSPITVRLVPVFAWLRLKPNDVTILSLILGILSALYISQGGLENYLIGALLIQIAFMLDMVDGQLARYTGKGSEFGAYFDSITDRVKEFAVLFAIAFSLGTITGYQLMFFAVFVIVMRHYDFYERSKTQKNRKVERFSKDGTLSKLGRFKAVMKESALFGISERWALITLLLVFQWEYAILWVYVTYGGFIMLAKAIGGWYAYRR